MKDTPSIASVISMCLLLACGAARAGESSLDVLRIHYSDQAGRTIDYDFTSGEMDEAGTVDIPDVAVLQRPGDESETIYTWGDPFGFGDAQLDVSPPGTYSVPVSEDSFGFLYASLGGDGDAPASGNWTWEVETRGGPTVEIGVETEPFHRVANVHAGFQDFDEEGAAGTLLLFASLHNPETGGFLWSHTEMVDLDPVHNPADTLALRMSFTNDGFVMKTEYRLGDQDWELFSEHTLDEAADPVPGLFHRLPYVTVYDGGDYAFSPSLVLTNPDWEIIISSFGYSDILNDLTPGFEGREYLSGEWGAAVGYTLSESGPVAPVWLEPHFLFPDWTTNSDFEEVATIEHTSDDLSSAASTIANDHLEITQTFEMVDTMFGLPLGLTPADESGDGGHVRSSRYALRQTYTIKNVSGETISDLNLFQLLHGLQSEVSLYDDRPYAGPYDDYRHTTTQIGVDLPFFDDSFEDAGFEDYISFLSPASPAAFENSHYGIESEDSHSTGKPSVGAHLSIEENALDNTAWFAPEEPWVAGAQQWALGSLEPGERVSFDVLLTVSTGTRVSPENPAGIANGGAVVAGGLDFRLHEVTSAGTVFARHLSADADEKNEWIAQGELPAVSFDSGGDSLQAWDLSTTARFDGRAGLAFGYDEQPLPEELQESRLAVFHWNGGQWEERESMADPWNNRINSASDRFSWFALGVGENADNRFFTDDFSLSSLNPVAWHDAAGTPEAAFDQEGGRLQFLSDGTAPASVTLRSRAVFRLDEPFRVRADFETSHFSLHNPGSLMLAVFRYTGAPEDGIPDDVLFVENGTREWPDHGNLRSWTAVHLVEGEPVDWFSDTSSPEERGTFHIEYADGVFYFGRDGYGPQNALVSFTPEGWAETDLVSIALFGSSEEATVGPGDPAYFENFAIERRPAASYPQWAAAVATSDSAEPTASASGDRMPNLLRYAVGAGPYDSVAPHLPAIGSDSGNGPVIYLRRNVNASDIILEVESSENLKDWTVIARAEAGDPLESGGAFPAVIDEEDIDGSLKATTILPAHPSPSAFYRLRVHAVED